MHRPRSPSGDVITSLRGRCWGRVPHLGCEHGGQSSGVDVQEWQLDLIARLRWRVDKPWLTPAPLVLTAPSMPPKKQRPLALSARATWIDSIQSLATARRT